MWSAFVTGFANKASDLIEERDKEIQDTIKVQLAEMSKSRKDALQRARTREEEQLAAAMQLRNYGVDYGAIEKIIKSGTAENIVDMLSKEQQAGTLTPERVRRFIGPGGTEKTREEVIASIKKMNTPVRPADRVNLDTEMQGAFGLPSRAGKQQVKSTLATLGLTQEELESTELPSPVTGDFTPNIEAFAKKRETETTEEVQRGLRDIIARSQLGDDGSLLNFANEEDAIEFSRLSTLATSNAIAQAMVKVDEDKPETDSQIRTIIKESLTTGLTPFIISNVAQIQSNGDVVPITGDVEDIQSFLSTRNRIVESIAVNRGYIDPRTGRVSSRAAENALTPYAVIKDGKVVSWKTGAPGGDAKPAQPAAAPRASTPAATAARKPPQAAIERLKANKDNPKAKADFDAIFGPGSADEALKSGK